MINEYIFEWIQNNPFLIEFLILPCVSIIYSEIWNYVKKWWSSYKTRRHQDVLVKKANEMLPLESNSYFRTLHSVLFYPTSI